MDHKTIIARLLGWFQRNARDLPWRRTCDAYAIWVSEIMLQQTQVKTVLPYWERWMRSLPNVRSLARARPERLHKLWEGLGYYTRVRNMQKAAQAMLEKHGGCVPDKYEDLLELPGIGRYTAGAICSIAFNQPRALLDGNVIRVLTRLFGINGDPRERKVSAKLWGLAQKLVEEASRCDGRTSSALQQKRKSAQAGGSCAQFNQALMELGALVCTPRQPGCEVCPVAGNCVARRTGRVEKFPALGHSKPATPRRFVALVVERQGRFLVRQRPAGMVNAHLWEFPNVETGLSEGEPMRAATRALGFRPERLERLCTIQHSITRYRITLEAFRTSVNQNSVTPRPGGGAGAPGSRADGLGCAI